VHVYDISRDAAARQTEAALDRSRNRQSSFSFMKDLLPSYFSSEWSFAQFRLPDGRSICCFGQDPNSIIAVCADGSYFKYMFDPVKGGDAQQEGYAPFLKHPDD